MKYVKYIFVLLLVFTLSSCREETPDISNVYIDDDQAVLYQIGVDDISEFPFLVEYDNGDIETLLLSSGLVVDSALLGRVGYHLIDFVYEGKSFTGKYKVYETELDLEIINIYEEGLLSNQITGTYDDWIETIKGDSGVGIEDVEVNASGHLIVTLTDGSSIDAGKVTGEDGQDNFDMYYIVNFYSNNGFVISTQILEEGGDAVAPTPIITDGFVFTGWDKSYTNITNDLNVYPIVDIELYTVSFVVDGETIPDVTDVPYGTTIDLTYPQKIGQSFMGWYIGEDVDADRFYDFTVVTGDITLYARHELNEYHIQFVPNGGGYVSTIDYYYGDMVVAPNVPINGTLHFNGWYYDEAKTMLVDWDNLIVGNLVLFADWLDVDYEVIDDVEVRIDGVDEGHTYVFLPDEIEGLPVTMINGFAFQLSEFSYVELPSQLEMLGPGAFMYNENLMKLEFPNSVYDIGNQVCQKCESLEEVILPDTLTVVPNYAFWKTALTSIILPDTIESIGSGTFYNSPLASINFPDTINIIGSSAFENTRLVDVLLPDGVTHIYPYAFKDIPTLETLHIPSTVSYIGDGFLYNNPSLANLTLDPTNLNYMLSDRVLYNSAMDTLLYYPEFKTETSYTVISSVVLLHPHSIANNLYLEELTLPNSIAPGLLHINFDGMVNLEAFYVYATANPQQIDVQDGIIYDDSFNILYRCPEGTTLTTLTLDATVDEVADKAFLNVQSIETIVLNSGLFEIGDYAFSNMDSLTSFTFSSSVYVMGHYVFSDSDSLQVLDVPGSQIIGTGAFEKMDMLDTITFSEGTEVLPGYILKDTPNVTSVNIPSTVSIIYGETFMGASGMNDLVVAGSTYAEGDQGILYTADMSTLLIYLEGLTNTTFDVPDGTNSVNAQFGYNPYLERINIPASVTYYMGDVNFLPNLTELHFYRTQTGDPTQLEFQVIPFDGSVTIYIHGGVLQEYLDDIHSIWDMYEDIMVSVPE